jgi:hypothetical protein
MGYENCDVFFEDSKDNKYPDSEFCGDVSFPEPEFTGDITAIQIIRPNGSIERFVREQAKDTVTIGMRSWRGATTREKLEILKYHVKKLEAKQDVK